jgi:hypothetical protein
VKFPPYDFKSKSPASTKVITFRPESGTPNAISSWELKETSINHFTGKKLTKSKSPGL